ncbi:IclR family transcriptional regulator [Aliirhizobium smilacinae]|nr:IclR family transcriptional regulator [Rhizobium smilacinae]
MNSIPREVAGAQLLDRAVAILQAVRDAGPDGASLATLIEALELKQSTAHRILSSLEAHGLVDRDSRNKRYRIGATIVALAADAVDVTDLQEASRPALARLSAVTGETSFIAIALGLNAVCVERQTGKESVLPQWPLRGGIRPLGMDATGQALLAFLPTEQAEAALKANSHLFGIAGFPGEDVIRRQMADGQKDLFVLDRIATAEGETEIATPILNRKGFAVGALAIVVPSERLTKDGLEIITSVMIDEARQITDRLNRFRRLNAVHNQPKRDFLATCPDSPSHSSIDGD